MASDSTVFLRRDPDTKQWVTVPLADPAGDRLFYFNSGSGNPDLMELGAGLSNGSSILDVTHNETLGLQGGTSGEYFHLTSAEHTLATQFATGSNGGLLSSADWTLFNGKEGAIAAGTTSQYWRGDKTWQTLDKTAVGLGNVENTALSTWAGSTNLTTLGYANRSRIIDATAIACWGDSLTAAVYPYSLSKLTGLVYYNGGGSGETSTQIKTRMLAATDRYGQKVIIWAGRNNYTDPTTIKADIAAMVAVLTTTNYLVLSVLNSDIGGIGTSEYTLITGLNADLASIYGSHYLDVRSYLVSQYNPSIPQDVTDHSNDIPPSSLRVDSIHLTQDGYALVAAYIYSNFSALDHMLVPLSADGFSAALTDVLGGGFGPPVLFGSTLQVGVPVISGFNFGVFGHGTSLTKQGLFSNSSTQSAYFTVGRTDDEIEFGVAANAGDFFASAPAGAAIFKNFNWVNPIMIGIGGYNPTITITRGGGYGAPEPGYVGFGNQSPRNGIDVIGYSGDEARGSVRFTHSTSHDGQISFGDLSGTDVMRLSQFDHASVANRIDLLTLYPTGRVTTPKLDFSPQTTGFTVAGGATSKTLTVTDNSYVSQDYRNTGAPQFAQLGVGVAAAAGFTGYFSHSGTEDGGTSIRALHTGASAGSAYGVYSEMSGVAGYQNIALFANAVNGAKNYALYCYAGDVFLGNLPTSPSALLTGDTYIYNDGTHKFLCVK